MNKINKKICSTLIFQHGGVPRHAGVFLIRPLHRVRSKALKTTLCTTRRIAIERRVTPNRPMRIWFNFRRYFPSGMSSLLGSVRYRIAHFQTDTAHQPLAAPSPNIRPSPNSLAFIRAPSTVVFVNREMLIKERPLQTPL